MKVIKEQELSSPFLNAVFSTLDQRGGVCQDPHEI